MFEVPDSYRDLVNSFEKADAFIAIIIFALYCIAMALSGMLVSYASTGQITYRWSDKSCFCRDRVSDFKDKKTGDGNDRTAQG